jgi:hypothetical protein
MESGSENQRPCPQASRRLQSNLFFVESSLPRFSRLLAPHGNSCPQGVLPGRTPARHHEHRALATSFESFCFLCRLGECLRRFDKSTFSIFAQSNSRKRKNLIQFNSPRFKPIWVFSVIHRVHNNVDELYYTIANSHHLLALR